MVSSYPTVSKFKMFFSRFTEYDLSLVLTFCTCSVFVYVLILHFIRRHARKVRRAWEVLIRGLVSQLKHSALSPIDKSRASNRRTEIILTIQVRDGKSNDKVRNRLSSVRCDLWFQHWCFDLVGYRPNDQ